MRVRARSVIRWVGGLSAALVVVAAAWYTLFQAGVVVTPAPASGGNAAMFAWWRPVEWQTAGVHLLAAFGFLGIAAFGALLAAFRDGAPGWTRTAAALVVAGATVTAIANLVQLGGEQAMLDASTTKVDPDIVGTIGYAAERIAAALEMGGYAALGLGVLTLIPGLLAAGRAGQDRLLGGSSLVLGGGLLVLALLQEADPLGLADLLTAILAIVVLPTWIWRVARLDPAADEAAAPASAAGGVLPALGGRPR